MACSKSLFCRPSVIFLGLFIASIGSSLLVSGSPIPDGKDAEAHFNDAVKTADDFIQRAKNTFSGRVDDV